MTRMILFSLTLLLVLPLGSLANLLLGANTTLEWVVIALQTTALFALNRIVGRWYWFNYNTRQISLAILVLVLGYSYFMLEPGTSVSSYFLLGTNLAILALWLFFLLKTAKSAVPPVAP